MSRLPQMFIDDVIDHVGDVRTLKACSLVCSQWSFRSRKRLFGRVELHSAKDLGCWCASIRPGSSGPSSLVDTLSLIDSYTPTSIYHPAPWLQPQILSDAGLHLQSFSGLRAIEIGGWNTSTVYVSSMLGYLGSSFENVTKLVLKDIFVDASTLAMFISYFPHLDDLSISTIRPPRTLDGSSDLYGHVDIVPTRPHGKFTALKISSFRALGEIFKGIILLEPRFRVVNLEGVSSYNAWREFWPLIEACAESLEEFNICTSVTDADCDGLSFACCPNLREISLWPSEDQIFRPCTFVKKCLSTITSTQLSKISLMVDMFIADLEAPGFDWDSWDSLDVILYNLAGQYRPRYDGDKMLVHFIHVTSTPSDMRNFLRRYRERGTLRMGFKTIV